MIPYLVISAGLWPFHVRRLTTCACSGTHRPVDKRESNPTPSQLCGCSPQVLSAACSSLIPTEKVRTTTSTCTVAARCPKTEVTITVTSVTAVKSTYTETEYPAPDLKFKTKKTLTTTVPTECAGPAYTGVPGNPFDDGDMITIAVYPYFPQTDVECCVLCYNSAAFPNCVASAFGAGSLECELLVKVNATKGEPTSAQCPVGIENFGFGAADNGDGSGNAVFFPGPCGY